jgi:MFS family permease
MALVIAYSQKEQRDQNIGYIECFFGLGYLTGPLIGSLLFQYGGYTMPFLACGMFLLLVMPLLVFNLQRAKAKRREE